MKTSPSILSLRQKNRLLFPCILFSSLVILLLQKIRDLDLWYHLAIGAKIAETRTIPHQEFLVYPNAGISVQFHEWGFGLLTYLVQQLGDITALNLVNALVGSAIVFLLFLSCKSYNGSQLPALVTAYLFLSIIQFRLSFRPEMALYLFLATEIFLLESLLITKRFRFLIAIPILTFLLSQMHPSALFLLFILAAYCVQALWENRKNQYTSKIIISFSLTALCALLSSLLNPYGLTQLMLPLSFGSQDQLLARIVEFLPVMQTGMKLPYLFLSVASLLALATAQKKRPLDCLLFIVFCFLAYKYVRNVALFSIVMFIPLHNGIDRLYMFLRKSIISSICGTIIVTGAISFLFWVNLTDPIWGNGLAPKTFPEQSASYLKTFRPVGKILNFYDTGGYLAWRLRGLYQVFIDGRHYGQDRSLVEHDSILLAAPGWRQMMASYGINSIIVPATLPVSGKLIPLVEVLADDPEWFLVAKAPRDLLFFRKSVLPQTLVPKDKNLIWQAVVEEESDTLGRHTESFYGYLALGKAYLRLSQWQKAKEAFTTFLTYQPDNVFAQNMIQQLR